MNGRPRRATRPHLDSVLAQLWRAHSERMVARERGRDQRAANAKIRTLSQRALRHGLTPIELKIELKQMEEQTSAEHFRGMRPNGPGWRTELLFGPDTVWDFRPNGLVGNIIPPPPKYTGPNNWPAVYGWISRTYAPGTLVEFLRRMWMNLDNGRTVEVPAGTRGRVIKVEAGGTIFVRLMPAPYAGEEQRLLAEEIFHKGSVDLVLVPMHTATNVHELRALDDNWAPLQSPRPTKRYQLPTSQKKRYGGGLRPNVIPPPPHDPPYRQLLAWAQRTYAPGTRVKFSGGGIQWLVGAWNSWPTHGAKTILVPDETRGVVTRVTGDDYTHAVLVQVEVIDARSYARVAAAPPGETQKWMEADIHEMWRALDSEGTAIVSRIVGETMLNVLVPLDDNWAGVQRSKSIKRYDLPRSQKRTSRRVSPNPIPHPLHRGRSGFRDWVERTYSEGTPVRVKLPIRGWFTDNSERTVIEPGTVAEVVEVGQGGTLTIEGWLQAPMDGESRRFRASMFAGEAYVSLAALADNWGPSTRWSDGIGRAPTLPFAPNRRTSRRRTSPKRRTSRKKGRMRA